MKKGFTLAELMVAMSIFIVVMVISMGSITSIIESNRKARNVKTVLTDMNHAIESMSREMRFGTKFFCHWNYAVVPPYLPWGQTQDCTGLCPEPPFNAGCRDRFYFFSSDGAIIKYDFDSVPFVKSTRVLSFGPFGPAIPIMSSSTSVSFAKTTFYLIGSEPNDGLQPLIRLNFTFSVGGTNSKYRSDIVIQTVISPRFRDN